MPKQPNEHGWLWSEELGAWVGKWKGPFHRPVDRVWLRLYDREGRLLPLFAEKAAQRADEEKQRAESERLRAEKAEQELLRLKALLADKGMLPEF